MKNNTVTAEHKWPWRLIPLYIILIVGAYAIGFHDHDFSKDPSEWGALGDYVGGLVNPLTSILALYFLIKTYQSQSDELRATKKALEESATHQKAAADAQTDLLKLEIKRFASSEKQIMIQILKNEISSNFEQITFNMSEVNRVTDAHNKYKQVLSIEGDWMYRNEIVDNYRKSYLKKTEHLQAEIDSIRTKLRELHSNEKPT